MAKASTPELLYQSRGKPKLAQQQLQTSKPAVRIEGTGHGVLHPDTLYVPLNNCDITSDELHIAMRKALKENPNIRQEALRFKNCV